MATTAPRGTANTRYDTIAEVNANASRNLAWKDQDEARSQPMVPLNTGKKYVFRVKPGTYRKLMFKIPTLPDEFKNEKQEKVLTDRFEKRRTRIDGEKPKFNLDAVREAVGGDMIIFNPLPGGPGRQSSSFYATDNEDVYQYLMSIKKNRPNGMMKDVIVEYPTRMVEINGRSVPATTAGWEAAQEAFMADEVPQEK